MLKSHIILTLMSRFIKRNKSNIISELPFQDISRNTNGTNIEGADFDIEDASSWEDAWASVGGDGWI